MTHEDFMRRAIALSREHMEAGHGGPFGAVVVKDGKVIGEGWNQVTSANDPTAHAEVMAIREACRNLGTFDLSGAAIYASSEPCPMCLGAIYWARLECVYFANSRTDVAAISFDDARLYDEISAPPEKRSLPMIRLLAEEALEVFEAWRAKPDKQTY